MMALVLTALLQSAPQIGPVGGTPPGYVLKTPKAQRMSETLARSGELSPIVSRGAAVVECQVKPDGTLTACTAVEETPAGLGVGRALVAVVRTFKIEPVGADVPPISPRTLRVPLHFTAPR